MTPVPDVHTFPRPQWATTMVCTVVPWETLCPLPRTSSLWLRGMRGVPSRHSNSVSNWMKRRRALPVKSFLPVKSTTCPKNLKYARKFSRFDRSPESLSDGIYGEPTVFMRKTPDVPDRPAECGDTKPSRVRIRRWHDETVAG